MIKFDTVTRQIKAFTEVQRHQEHLDKITGEAEMLRPLVQACLDNDPIECSLILQLSEKIKPLKVYHVNDMLVTIDLLQYS